MAIVKRLDRFSTRSKMLEYYSDISINLNVVSGSQDVQKIINEDSITQALKNLIFTDRGERFFNPEYGTNIKQSLFEPLDATTETLIRSSIENSIKNFEPRVEMRSLDIFQDPDLNYVAISLIFGLINKTDPITADIVVNRIR
jgi:phage baseplate assembly protein W